MLHDSTKLTPRQRRHQANLGRILQSAVTLVEAEGFDALTIHRLAKITDYTPGALYRYFANKDALTGAVLTEVIESFARAETHALCLLPQASCLERIVLVAYTYKGLCHSAPNRFGLLARALAESKNLISSAEAAGASILAAQRALAPIAQGFAEAQELGLLHKGDAIQRGVAMFTSLHGVLMLRKQARLAPQLINLDALYAEVLRTLFVGWGANRPQVDDAIQRITALDNLIAHAGVPS